MYHLKDKRFGCRRCKYKFGEFTGTYIGDFNFSLDKLGTSYVPIRSRSTCIQDQVLCTTLNPLCCSGWLFNLAEEFTCVYHITGDTHHSLVLEMKDYIIAVEAPLYQERSQAVIHEINKLWPSKPIRYIVQTHSHDDHIGGLRAYAADGAIVVTSEVSKDRVRQILNASHTIRPDTLQLHPRQVVMMEPVSQKKIISDGNRSVEIYPVKNSHTDDMLAVYLPKEKILLDSDLYSPGGSPAPFKVYAKQLLDFITQTGINVKIIAGTHGGFGPYTDLQKFVNQDIQTIPSHSSSNHIQPNHATLNILGED